MNPWSKNPRTVTGHEHRFTDVDAPRHLHTQFAEAQIPSRHLITDPPDQAEAVAALIRQRIADGSLIRRILVLVDSIKPLDRLCSIAARILAWCFTMLLCSFTHRSPRSPR